MSWQSLANVFEYVQRKKDLTSPEAFVLVAIANFTNEHGTNAYPSLATLAIFDYRTGKVKLAIAKKVV